MPETIKKKSRKAPKKKPSQKPRQKQQKPRQKQQKPRQKQHQSPVNVNVNIDQSRRTTSRGRSGPRIDPKPLVIPTMSGYSAQEGLINDLVKKVDEKDEKANELIKKITEKDTNLNELALYSQQNKPPSIKDTYRRLIEYHNTVNPPKPVSYDFKDPNEPTQTNLPDVPPVGAPTGNPLADTFEGAGAEETKDDVKPSTVNTPPIEKKNKGKKPTENSINCKVCGGHYIKDNPASYKRHTLSKTHKQAEKNRQQIVVKPIKTRLQTKGDALIAKMDELVTARKSKNDYSTELQQMFDVGADY
jgi:hypothetical protein